MTVRQLIQYLMDLALEDPKILNYKIFTEAEQSFVLTANQMTIDHENKKVEIEA